MKGRSDVLFLLVLLVGSLSLNVYLGWRIQTVSTPGGIPVSVLKEGTIIQPVNLKDQNSTEEVIDFAATNKPTVLYVFTPTCVWCERNFENIRTLASSAGPSYKFLGLSLSETGLKEYLAEHKLNFPVYTAVSPETAQRLLLGSTPQTIVISPTGTVVKNWIGAFGKNSQSEAEAFFGVRLPGLTGS